MTKLYQEDFLNISQSSPNSKNHDACFDGQKKLRQEISNQEILALDIVNDDHDLNYISQIADNIKQYDKTLILGVGGSSLGGKTLTSLANNDDLIFLESIDPSTIKKTLDKIDFAKTFFLIISKSGQTIETICQLLIILEKLDELKISDYSQQFLLITEEKNDSPLLQLAQKLNIKIANHPQVGGRYSCFSIVGLLPAAICGLDIKKIKNGAKEAIIDFLNNDDLAINCATQLDLYDSGFDSNVIMPYIDDLKNFTDWYRQLWSESLGKNGFGATPVNSMGTIDQHSQLQLYLDGPENKFFTFILAKNHKDDFLIKDISQCETLFGGKNLSSIVQVEQETTIEVLRQKNRPIRIIEIEKLDEKILGFLMMQIFLETILIAYAKNFDPFDQPGVEVRKNLARKILNNN